MKMAFEGSSSGGTSAAGPAVGPSGQFVDPGLTDGWFDGHPKTGDWETLKGKMLQPWEFDGIESTSETGASRAHSPSPSTAPNSTIQVDTPLTMGGGTFAK
jgi:hypothetical protein